MTGSLPARPVPVPWYVWMSVLAVTSAMVGVHWDISWHRSIGRDAFLTPAHIAIYMCGVLAGISCGYLILSTTFGHSPLRQTSVNIWGFRGPLGAFIAAWAGFVMLTSAPFDDWWHSAYGLDVKILSPPHMVLALGMIGVEFGALILILGQMNRATPERRRWLDALFLYVGAMILVALLVISMEYSGRSLMHSGLFYYVVSLVAPVALAGVARASGSRWAATTVAAIYSVLLLLLLWILPLFPATPKLGPVYHPVTFFIPAGFPLLLIVPALLLDTLWTKKSQWGDGTLAAVSGPLFLAAFAAVQWPFAIFLCSPAARNAFFGSGYFDYNTRPTSYQARYLFVPVEHSAGQFWMHIAMAVVFATLSIRLGLAWGNWMRTVKR